MAAVSPRTRQLLSCTLALALSVVVLLPLARDLAHYRGKGLPAPFRSGDDYRAVLEHKSFTRWVSIYIGFAARDIAGGTVDEIVVPLDLDDIADRKGDSFQGEPRPAFNGPFMRQSSGARLARQRYNTTLTAEQIAALKADFEVRTYPREVVAFIGKNPEKRVVLYTDAARHTVYVIPWSANPAGGAR